jgi:hypothetical protein
MNFCLKMSYLTTRYTEWIYCNTSEIFVIFLHCMTSVYSKIPLTELTQDHIGAELFNILDYQMLNVMT